MFQMHRREVSLEQKPPRTLELNSLTEPQLRKADGKFGTCTLLVGTAIPRFKMQRVLQLLRPVNIICNLIFHSLLNSREMTLLLSS